MPLAQVLFTPDEIRQRVKELARDLDELLDGERPILIGVLKGSVMFLSDLVREMSIDSDVDFMSISSYEAQGPKVKTGVVRIVKDIEDPIEGRHVVVVEDIVDTGLSLEYLLSTLRTREPASLRVLTLIDKPVRRIIDPQVDLAGFESQEFLVGYGLDYKGKYRNLPYIASVSDPSALAADPGALVNLFEP